MKKTVITDFEGVLSGAMLVDMLREFYNSPRILKEYVFNLPIIAKYAVQRSIEASSFNKISLKDTYPDYRRAVHNIAGKLSDFQKKEFAKKYIVNSKNLRYFSEKFKHTNFDIGILTNGVSELVDIALEIDDFFDKERFVIISDTIDKSQALRDYISSSKKEVIYISDGWNDRDLMNDPNIDFRAVKPISNMFVLGSGILPEAKPFKETIDSIILED